MFVDSGNPLVVHNTLSREKEPFVPASDKIVKAFFCGQTVYDDAHLGHAKAYINFDVAVRWLRYLGYKVTYIQNITDIDDKIIKRAKERGIEPMELAREYEKRFIEDLEAIDARKQIDLLPRSHDYIEPIREQIQLLFDNGYAYCLDGDVYYDVSKFGDYTKLSGMKIEELERHRIEPKEGKKNVYDFALWKAAKPGEPTWKITVKVDGKSTELDGRPGWHIEDTAITYKEFGPQYDLHGGASELIFPHHTNEIAQAEAAFGKKPFVKYWMHVGVLTVNGVKMSKSLGNFVTIRSALEKHRSEALRLLFCTTHYRKEVDYTDASIGEAGKRLGYLYAALSLFYNMNETEVGPKDAEINDLAKTFGDEFTVAMNDDFNTPQALGTLATTLNKLRAFAENNVSVGKIAKSNMIDAMLRFARILGILEEDIYKRPLPKEALQLIQARQAARKQKKFDESDRIRKQLKDEYNIIVEDSPDGQKWYPDLGNVQ